MNSRSENPSSRGRWRWIALAIVVLLVLSVLALPLLLDPERFRGRIEAALEQTTGWNAELGEIDVSVWGGLALRVSPAELAAPDEGSSISVGALSVDASLLPLFRGELDVSSIELIEPTIVLVRESTETGWQFPRTGGEESSPPSAALNGNGSRAETADGPPEGPESEAKPAVSIALVEITDGRARLVDRSGSREKSFGLEDLDLTLRPLTRELEGSGRVEGDDGRLVLSASPGEGWSVELSEVDSGAFEVFLDDALLRTGGALSGTVKGAGPDIVEGRVEGRGLPLLAGETPLDALDARFTLRKVKESWSLESLDAESGAVKLSGTGSITPEIDLEFELRQTDLEPALSTARSLFPLPLELSAPGSVDARARVWSSREKIRYDAEGSLRAARFVAGGPLPPVEDLAARFTLDEAGSLRIDIDEARAAEGPLEGVARLDRVYPPGTLSFEGRLEDASMGGLLAGFLGEKARTIRGPTSLNTSMTMDLSGESLSPAALGGRLSLRSANVSLPGWDLENALYRKLDEKLQGLGALRELLGKELGEAGSGERDEGAGDERVVDLLDSDVVFSGPPWSLEGLDVTAGDVSASGGGSFDPASGSVDLELTARLDRDDTDRLVRKEKALRALVGDDGRLTVPLTLEGPLTSPKIGVEIRDLLRGRGAQDALEGLVEGLLGGRDEKKDEKR